MPLSAGYSRYRFQFRTLSNTTATVLTQAGANATGLQSASGNPVTNPVPIDSNGNVEFFAPSATYTLKIGADSHVRLSGDTLSQSDLSGLDQPMSYGTGVPNASAGRDGYFFFRSDGGVGTAIYQRRSGAWVAIA